MKKSLKEFFSFSKAELNGLLVFSLLVMIIAMAPSIYSYFSPPEIYNHSSFKKEVNELMASASKQQSQKYFSAVRKEIEEKEVASELFVFNPNNLPDEDWMRLGLSAKQIRVIKNYESKGGRFYTKEDLRKIYSIRPGLYSRLEPFIQIPERTNAYKKDYVNTYKTRDVPRVAVIDINKSDSTQLESLNGIGPAFASRIIKYRNRLGGFCKKEQLKEVYGLDSTLYQKLVNQIAVNPAAVRQISINTATFEDLKKHPYLSYKQMNAIIQYRKQHGMYKDINDLKPIAILNDNVLAKIEPYLSFNSR
ncbi:MAG: helix-hairpin-helix domain-containing protein [Sphingobacteriaceae bacterium]|nr:helix-hairpin-helix domain-containing protein [Sphingobacteriaceae bacterium]